MIFTVNIKIYVTYSFGLKKLNNVDTTMTKTKGATLIIKQEASSTNMNILVNIKSLAFEKNIKKKIKIQIIINIGLKNLCKMNFV